jgi:hypothetical protein|tara:strand:- start:928 stop:1668 length:741 start_codon:yes stop_codon:yes gene_type:complete
MKIAICISGQARFWEKGYKLLNKQLLSILPNYDIFISTWDQDNIKDIINLYQPVSYKVENFIEDNIPYNQEWKSFLNLHPNNSNSDPYTTLPMLYKIKDCFDLVKDYCDYHNESYDLVIRLRFDTFYPTPINLYQLFDVSNNNTLAINESNLPQEKGWFYDGFAFGGMEVMEVYSNLFNHLISQALLSNTWVIHKILGDYLQKHNILTTQPDNVIGAYKIEKNWMYFLNNYSPSIQNLAWDTYRKT